MRQSVFKNIWLSIKILVIGSFIALCLIQFPHQLLAFILGLLFASFVFHPHFWLDLFYRQCYPPTMKDFEDGMKKINEQIENYKKSSNKEQGLL